MSDILKDQTLSQVKAALDGAGYKAVRTMSGEIPLSEWTPYGMDGVNGPAPWWAVWDVDVDRGIVRDAPSLETRKYDRPDDIFLYGAWEVIR